MSLKHDPYQTVLISLKDGKPRDKHVLPKDQPNNGFVAVGMVVPLLHILCFDEHTHFFR